ncbi:MAG: helix-turn-helix domain-containing protein [Actinomycetota bacterium]
MSIRVLEWVFGSSEVDKRSDLLVLLVLAYHAHDDGDGAWPAVLTIAQKARLSRRAVQVSLRRLEAMGAIEVTGHEPGRRTTYRVVMGGATTARGAVAARGATTAREGRSERTGGAKQASPEPLTERSGKNRQKGAHSVRPTDLDPVYPIGSNNGAKTAFAAEHFPDVEPGYVSDAAWKLKRRRGAEPTVGNIRDVLRDRGVVS